MSGSDKQQQAIDLQREGLTRRQIAAEMGMKEVAVKSLIRRARANGLHLSFGARQAMLNANLDGVEAKGGWIHNYDSEGKKIGTTRWSAPVEETESVVDALRAGLEECPRAEPIPNKQRSANGLATVLTVADLHIGLLTDEEEVGTDWDTKKARDHLERTFGRLVSVTPDAEVAVLAQLGDLTHNDDQRNVTPQNKHQLDVDSRYFVILRRAVAAMKWCIDTMRQKYPKVIYRGCRGNHDITSHYAVTLALMEHYKDCPDVEIVDHAGEFYVFEFGQNMLLLHHGDKAKPERLVHFAAAEWPQIWGRTRHRLALSGHVHHETRKEIGGMFFESVGTIVPRDAYAYSHAYSASRALVSITFDQFEGEVSRARVACK